MTSAYRGAYSGIEAQYALVEEKKDTIEGLRHGTQMIKHHCDQWNKLLTFCVLWCRCIRQAPSVQHSSTAFIFSILSNSMQHNVNMYMYIWEHYLLIELNWISFILYKTKPKIKLLPINKGRALSNHCNYCFYTTMHQVEGLYSIWGNNQVVLWLMKAIVQCQLRHTYWIRVLYFRVKNQLFFDWEFGNM